MQNLPPSLELKRGATPPAYLPSVDLSGCTSLQTIGDSAFSGCTALETIYIPGGKTVKDFNGIDLSGSTDLKSIGSSAFSGCKKLTDIVFSPHLEFIGYQAFDGCEKIANVYFTGKNPPTLLGGNTGGAYNSRAHITIDQVFHLTGLATDTATLIYYPIAYTSAYAEEGWQAENLQSRMVPYYGSAESIEGQMHGLKPSKNGNPPEYEVWDTVNFQVSLPTADPQDHAPKSTFKSSGPKEWKLVVSTPAIPAVVGLIGPIPPPPKPRATRATEPWCSAGR